jgi:hypothetical protein
MALENINISDGCYDGAGVIFLYYLEADTSRPKMVEVVSDKKIQGRNYADIGCCDSYLSVRNNVRLGPYHRDRIDTATGE